VTQMVQPYSISQPLGLFFVSLLFLYLAIKLPALAADTVGSITSHFRREVITPAVSVSREMGMAPTAAVSGAASSVQAAAAITPTSATTATGFVATSPSSVAAATTVAPSTVQAPGMLGGFSAVSKISQGRAELAKAAVVNKSVSDATSRKLKKTFLQALAEREGR